MAARTAIYAALRILDQVHPLSGCDSVSLSARHFSSAVLQQIAGHGLNPSLPTSFREEPWDRRAKPQSVMPSPATRTATTCGKYNRYRRFLRVE